MLTSHNRLSPAMEATSQQSQKVLFVHFCQEIFWQIVMVDSINEIMDRPWSGRVTADINHSGCHLSSGARGNLYRGRTTLACTTTSLFTHGIHIAYELRVYVRMYICQCVCIVCIFMLGITSHPYGRSLSVVSSDFHQNILGMLNGYNLSIYTRDIQKVQI